MYSIYIDGVVVYDALDDTPSVSSASISQSINAAAYLDFTCVPSVPVEIIEGSSIAEVLWDSTTLFHGKVTDVTQNTEGLLEVSCVSDIDRLNDVLVRPNSTDGSVGEKSPDSLGAYFQWLITQFNQQNVGGFRIDVNVNQGDQLREVPLSISDDSYPTVAASIQNNVLSNGGYLEYTPYTGSGTLDLYADLHEASNQLIDFGENVVSIEVTRSSESQYTALVPYATVDDSEITLSKASETELQMLSNAGFSVNGDAFYSNEQVAEFGYREERVEFSGATSVSELISLAIPHLLSSMSASLTVTCQAVDMALYKDGYDHLKVGQAVHVRSALHGIDEYMAVQDMDLDLEDPSQTSYTLGVSYDTLTGQQSAFLSKLNGSINGALDKVTGLEDTINKVVNDSNVEYYVSTSPDEPTGGEWGVAVVTPTDNKYIFSHTKNELVDGTIVTSDPTLVTPSITRSLQLHRDFGTEGYTWVNFIAANYDVTDDAAGVCRIVGQMGGWDADKQGAVTVAFGFQDSAYSTGSGSMAGVGVVSEKSSDIDLDATDILSFVDNGRVSVFVRCKGKVTVNLYAEGDGFSTPFIEQDTQPGGTQVFDLADVQTTYDSAILQADNAIRAYVSATYATQDALGQVESTFDLRANQIEASVEEKMDTSVANSTFVDKSTYNQFSDSITQSVESVRTVATDAQTAADGAQQTADAASTAASAAQSAANSASAAAGNAQSTADSASTAASDAQSAAEAAQADLDSYKGTVSTTYATKTEVQQTASGITQSVSETYVTKTSASETYQPKGDYATGAELDATDAKADAAQTAASGAQSTANAAQSAATSAQSTATQALTKATEVEQTAEGLTTTVSQVQQTAEGAVTTATEAKQTAEGFEARITQANDTANIALNTANGNGQLLYECRVAPNSDYGWILLTADSTLNDGGNTGYAHVWGWIGGWTAKSGGYLDVMIPLRDTSCDSIVVTQKDNQIASYGSGNGATLRVYLVNDRVRVTIAVKGYAQVKLFVEGTGFTINNESGNSGEGTYIWDSDGAIAQSAKTATNYLKFDSSGLCIGNMTGTLGYNALITSSQYQIRNGSTVLSSFGASQVQLGQNSTSAQIQMCGGRGKITYNSSNMLVINTSNSSYPIQLGDVNSLFLNGYNTTVGRSSNGSTRINGGNISIGNRGTGLYGIYVGTSIVNPGGNSWYALFSTSAQVSKFGRVFNVDKGDVFVAQNGDTNAQNIGLVGTWYDGAGNIGVSFNSGVSGNYRIQWLCIMGA